MESSDNKYSLNDVDETYPVLGQKKSFRWERFQGIIYLIGSACFMSGSCMYYTPVFEAHSRILTIDGWLFTIGSLLYLLADLQDWWNNQIRFCCDRSDQQLTGDNSVLLHFGPSDVSSPEKHTSAKIEINQYCTTCGMIFFLVGSVFFIPTFEKYLTFGEWCFILGSGISALSLLWKLVRSARFSADDLADRRFRLHNLLKDRSSLFMDGCSVIGNLLFFVGTIFFLPSFSITDSDENRAVSFFVCGSACFLISSLYLQYTLYCSSHKQTTVCCFQSNKS